LQKRGVTKAALLGTRFTMQEDFYKHRLAERFGIQTLLLSTDAMTEIDRIIFAELCRGEFHQPARDFYLDVLEQLRDQGAEAAILGCTEIGLLLEGVVSPLPLVDSTREHVAMGLKWLQKSA
jgi:aspartate racemase